MGCSNTCVAGSQSRGSPPLLIPAGHNGKKKQTIEPTGLPLPFYDAYSEPELGGSDANYVLACQSDTHKRWLKVRVWVNGKPARLENTDLPEGRNVSVSEESDDSKFPHDAIGLYATKTLGVSENEPITVVASFSLVLAPEDVPPAEAGQLGGQNIQALDPNTVANYLGITDAPIRDDVPWSSPYRLWSMVLDAKTGGHESALFRLNTIGRCIEEVMGVLLVPTASLRIEPPSSTLASADRGLTKNSANARPMALVQNIVACQSVDLASTL